jgi:hypothetical protein
VQARKRGSAWRWIIVAVIGVTAPTSASAATANWGQYGLNPWHSSFNTNETTLTRTNVGHLTLAWSRALLSATPADYGPPVLGVPPVVASGSVFVASGEPSIGEDVGAVAAFSLSSGAAEWVSITCEGSDVFSLAYANGLVIDTDAGFEATAMNAITGGNGCTDGGPIGAIAVQGSLLLYDFGGTIGETSQDLNQNVWQTQVGSATTAASSPGINSGVVYASNGATLAALSEQTGSAMWTRNVDPTCACLSAPSGVSRF